MKAIDLKERVTIFILHADWCRIPEADRETLLECANHFLSSRNKYGYELVFDDDRVSEIKEIVYLEPAHGHEVRTTAIPNPNPRSK